MFKNRKELIDMDEKLLKELRECLENVSDSYDDFVEGGIMTAKNHVGYAEKLLAHIKANPNETTSDIIKYETEELLGIKPLI